MNDPNQLNYKETMTLKDGMQVHVMTAPSAVFESMMMPFDDEPDPQIAVDAKNIETILSTDNPQLFENAMHKLAERMSPALVALSQEQKDILTNKIQNTQDILLENDIATRTSELARQGLDVEEYLSQDTIDSWRAYSQGIVAKQTGSLYGMTQEKYLTVKQAADTIQNNGPAPA